MHLKCYQALTRNLSEAQDWAINSPGNFSLKSSVSGMFRAQSFAALPQRLGSDIAHLDRDAINVLLLRRAGHAALLNKGDATRSLHTCIASAQQIRNGVAELTHGHAMLLSGS